MIFFHGWLTSRFPLGSTDLGMATVGTQTIRAQSPVARSPRDAAVRAARSPAVLMTGSLSLALLWSYWPTLGTMVERWWSDPQYSHGFLVPLFAAAVLWSRRDLWDKAQSRPSWWGLPVLAIAVAMRLV